MKWTGNATYIAFESVHDSKWHVLIYNRSVFSVITELFPNFLTTRQYTYMQLSMYIFIFNSFVQLRLYLQQCLSYTSSLPLYTLINARFHQFVDYCILLMWSRTALIENTLNEVNAHNNATMYRYIVLLTAIFYLFCSMQKGCEPSVSITCYIERSGRLYITFYVLYCDTLFIIISRFNKC